MMCEQEEGITDPSLAKADREIKQPKIVFKNWDGLPVFTQDTLYHVRTETRQSLDLILYGE